MAQKERAPESFEDFAYRFQLAQGLPTDQKGIILIGNTRAGKSTLALSMTGAQMKIVFDSGNLTYVNPVDSSFQEVVRNTQQSVTQKPNFYKSSPYFNKYSIVDMPGHADSSRFRELINFHYIRTMASNLKYVRFLIVVTMQIRNEKAELPTTEIDMLESFRIMFPGCSQYIKIIINRVQNLAANEKLVKKSFRQAIAKHPKLKSYYANIIDRDIYVIERPPYRKSVNGESRYEKSSYEEMNKRTREICHDSEAQFMQLGQNDYYTLNIFKEGDQENNKHFFEKLKTFLDAIRKGVKNGFKAYQTAVNKLISSSILKKSAQRQISEDIIQFLKAHNIETPCKKPIYPIESEHSLLDETQIIQFVKLLSQQLTEDKYLVSQKEKEKYYKQIVLRRFSKILQIVQRNYSKGELYKHILDLTLYFDRRITEFYFISNIIKQQNVPEFSNGNLSSDINMSIRDGFNRIQLFDNLYKISQYFLNLSFPQIFNHYQHHFHQLSQELLNNYHNIQKLREQSFGDKYKEKEIKSHIPAKIQELSAFIIIHYEPKQHEIHNHIQKLLNSYSHAHLEMKVKIVYKLAKTLQKENSYRKNSLFLYLYLRLNEEAMRIFTHIEHSFKKQQAYDWSIEISKVFQQTGMLMYAQRCLQIGKKWSIDDLDKFLQLDKKILKLNDQAYSKQKIESQLQNNNKQKYWNWQKINEEIAVLKNKFAIKDNSPIKSLLLKKHR